MYRFLLIIFICIAPYLSGLDLKSRLKDAEAGDYIVYLYKSHATLVRIADKSEDNLVLEEISAPYNDTLHDWQAWIDKKAPGHTSWTVNRINLKTGKVEASYSLEEGGIAMQTTHFTLLPTLFQLKLEPIPETVRKKIGPEPMGKEVDVRKLWFPTITFEQKVITPPIDALRVIWPDDDSELAGRPIDIYIPQKEALTYFPYWIEVSGGPLKAKIFAVDSGKRLRSSYQQV